MKKKKNPIILFILFLTFFLFFGHISSWKTFWNHVKFLISLVYSDNTDSIVIAETLTSSTKLSWATDWAELETRMQLPDVFPGE